MKLILLLRAINLGKINRVSMHELKIELINMGFSNIKTLLQSGNVYIESDSFNHEECRARLSSIFGFDMPIIVTNYETLLKLSKNELFKENTMIIFTNEMIDEETIDLLNNEVSEEFRVIDQCILINYTQAYQKTKFNNSWFERKLRSKTTIRNHRTVLKMIESFK